MAANTEPTTKVKEITRSTSMPSRRAWPYPAGWRACLPCALHQYAQAAHQQVLVNRIHTSPKPMMWPTVRQGELRDQSGNGRKSGVGPDE